MIVLPYMYHIVIDIICSPLLVLPYIYHIVINTTEAQQVDVDAHDAILDLD
jgi:hypothetical protein